MAESDPYIAYTHRFFRKWAGVYDWFAASIFYAYGAAVRVLHPIAGLRVLDICTGTGAVALRCAARGAGVTGLDITPAMLGGPKVLMLETLLYQKVNVAGDLPAASVIAVLLLATTIAVNQGLRRVAR